jgi:hypothetical protein
MVKKKRDKPVIFGEEETKEKKRLSTMSHLTSIDAYHTIREEDATTHPITWW